MESVGYRNRHDNFKPGDLTSRKADKQKQTCSNGEHTEKTKTCQMSTEISRIIMMQYHITQHITRLSESTKFLERCRRSGLSPNFIDNATKNLLYTINNNICNIRLPTKFNNAISNYLTKVQCKLLNLIIQIKHELLKQKEKEVNILINQQLSTNDSTTFFESENLLGKKLATTIKKTQTNKYEKLRDKHKQLLNIKNVPGWFYNTSTIIRLIKEF
ncbi:PREDICTED: uncharacterized protein LOC108359471 [Rhagoletis zephyria]|uniref:uncharacterized protein LOC108359471 n=1 Tax=Rhagoletis zephyria TaxID=28612 RepID=UPI0008115D7B|nr:PREDICTED: uncharacterized protein LOC108359471 [Rhagoletis zephyria]